MPLVQRCGADDARFGRCGVNDARRVQCPGQGHMTRLGMALDSYIPDWGSFEREYQVTLGGCTETQSSWPWNIEQERVFARPYDAPSSLIWGVLESQPQWGATADRRVIVDDWWYEARVGNLRGGVTTRVMATNLYGQTQLQGTWLLSFINRNRCEEYYGGHQIITMSDVCCCPPENCWGCFHGVEHYVYRRDQPSCRPPYGQTYVYGGIPQWDIHSVVFDGVATFGSLMAWVKFNVQLAPETFPYLTWHDVDYLCRHHLAAGGLTAVGCRLTLTGTESYGYGLENVTAKWRLLTCGQGAYQAGMSAIRVEAPGAWTQGNSYTGGTLADCCLNYNEPYFYEEEVPAPFGFFGFTDLTWGHR